MRWRRPSIKPSKFGTVYKKDCGECFVLRSFSFGETEPCAQSLSPYSSFVIDRKRVVLLFLSFPKEKVTKKKGNLRACALKNPLIVQSFCAQSKTSCLPFSQLQVPLRRTLSRFVALRRASRGEICTRWKEKRNVGATIGRACGGHCREIRIPMVRIRFRPTSVMLT